MSGELAVSLVFQDLHGQKISWSQADMERGALGSGFGIVG